MRVFHFNINKLTGRSFLYTRTIKKNCLSGNIVFYKYIYYVYIYLSMYKSIMLKAEQFSKIEKIVMFIVLKNIQLNLKTSVFKVVISITKWTKIWTLFQINQCLCNVLHLFITYKPCQVLHIQNKIVYIKKNNKKVSSNY